ncbi:RNA polymerase sigma factor SigW [Salinithrix halophila]|uniref:RNA polymerase sigma factor SigW n=1 Tax=Salinithrix halophila TaxID=1485204 RepID=UPI0036D2B874
MTEQREKILIKQAQTGDCDAFVELIQLYRKQVYALAYRKLNHAQEAEDVTQEVILRSYTHLARYHADRRFSSWLYRITVNLCIDRLRKKKADFYLDAPTGGDSKDWYHHLPGKGLTPEESLIRRETEREIILALEGLPSRYRSVMILRYMQQLPLADIGEILHLPVTTVKIRVHRGRKALRSQLASCL